MSYWKSGHRREQDDGKVRRLLEPLVAFVSRDPAAEPPERPRRFTIVDEHGNEREVYAPPGRVTRLVR